MKTWKVEAAIIAVGMVLLGVIIKWGINRLLLLLRNGCITTWRKDTVRIWRCNRQN